MSYRGGHSGAVAVSFSTSTMSPLSPTRRYSGSTGSGASVTSGTNGTTTSKYSNYRSSTPSNLGNDRNGGYYSSASNAGYRGSSYTSPASSDTFRRAYYSPARSVSSYNESSTFVGSSALSGSGLRYGSSASSSSASSSAGSSNSSYGSRDRNTLQHHTPGSLATTAADLYAIYSPSNYVPNIHGGGAKSGGSSSSNWRSASSSGASSILSSELHGGDEYDSCRERRERSYSSEASSGLGATCNSGSTTSSNNQNSHLPGSDRWTTRREVNNKRRVAPSSIGATSGVTSNNLVAGDANKTDVGSSLIEVTLDPEGTARSRNTLNRRNNGLYVVTSNVNARDNGINDDEILTPEESADVDSNPETRREPFVIAINDSNDRNDLDNNNDDGEARCKSSPIDSTKTYDNSGKKFGIDSTLEAGRRRRHGVAESAEKNLTVTDDRLDARHGRDNENGDDNGGRKNLTTVVRIYRDNADDVKVRERAISKNDTKHNFLINDHHHQRKRHSERTSINDANNHKNHLDIPNSSLSTGNPLNEAPTPTSVARFLPSISQKTCPESVNPAAPSFSTREFEADDNDNNFAPKHTPGLSARPKNTRETDEFGNLKSSANRDVANVGGGESDCGVVVVVGSSANSDNHRKALTRTKIPTNNDNTELLTNNNVHGHELDLGIVETNFDTRNEARNGSVDDRNSGTNEMIKGNKKTLLWTASSDCDDDTERVSIRRDNIFVNGGESNDYEADGHDKPFDNDDEENSRDPDRDETSNGTSSITRNGVRSSGNRSNEIDQNSISRKTLFGWNDPTTVDDLTGASSSPSTSSSSSSSSTAASSAATSSANATNSVPVAVHQNIYRGINDQIDETSNSRAPRSRLSSRRDERYGLNGLRNIGNTCFMNSVIQCLSNTRPLLEYLLNEQHLQDINTTTSSMKGALIKAFGQVIQELWEMSGDHVVNTSSLKSQIQRFAPRFMGYSQQDAQEFLRYLLEGLHEDVNRVTAKPQPILTDIPDHYSDSHKASESWKRYLRSEDSMIVDIFVGQLRSSLLCTACDHVSVTLDPFWDLSLPIPLRLGTVKLNQCLEHFTKAETLDGDEKPTCSKCQMRRKCTKSFSIQKFPKILVIHLKRFSPTERFRGKLSVLVDFPLTCLDLSAFAAPGVQGCTYNLYGVANHSGTTYSGHYTAYCKHPYSGEWHEYNDSRVSTVPARSVVSSEAYVLFYEQQLPSPHL